MDAPVRGDEAHRVLRRFRLDEFRLVVAALLLAIVVDAVFASRGWRDPDFAFFAAAGRTMLSGAWRHTFHNPAVQAGPFQLLTAHVLYRIGWSRTALAVATELALGGALMATTRSIVGRRAVPLAFVVTAALLLGVIPDAYATGHLAEPVVAILWLLAAREARAGRIGRAGLLVGASAGFELWGVLGITVLALTPSLERAAIGAVLACATAGLTLAPFVLGGDFHMFAFHWHVADGPIHFIVGSGYPFGWPLRLLQGAATLVVGVGLARLLRKSSASIFIIPAATVIVRLLLDPLGLYYYWDPLIELALLGAAAAFVRRGALQDWLDSQPRLVRASRVRRRRRRPTPVPG
jgi:hypothetical protein